MRKGDRIKVPRSREHRQKLSLAMRGNKNHAMSHSEEAKGKISIAMLGNKHTQGKKYGIETRLKDRKAKLGANNPAWQGGISLEPYSPEFNIRLKQRILERDSFRCQICKQRNDLHIHHVNYDKRDCQGDNLITLCHSCHSRTNHHRDEWRLFDGQFQRMENHA